MMPILQDWPAFKTALIARLQLVELESIVEVRCVCTADRCLEQREVRIAGVGHGYELRSAWRAFQLATEAEQSIWS